MEYEVLYFNDNGTAKVHMVIGSAILEQDIAVGDSQDEFNTNVLNAMAVFQAEITANSTISIAPSFIDLNSPVNVTTLPEISDSED